MEIVSDATTNDIISWLPDGKGFVVKNKEKLSEKVLPRYFKSSKYESFTRNLNRWGFAYASRGSEPGACSHPHFQRDDQHLCKHMGFKQNQKQVKAQHVQMRYIHGSGLNDYDVLCVEDNKVMCTDRREVQKWIGNIVFQMLVHKNLARFAAVTDSKEGRKAICLNIIQKIKLKGRFLKPTEPPAKNFKPRLIVYGKLDVEEVIEVVTNAFQKWLE